MAVPENLILWDYSIAVTLMDGRIFISGGINAELKNIQKCATILKPVDDTFEVEEIENMKHGRYTHTSTVLNEHVYVLGGRYFGCGESGVLFHCERYDFINKKWEELPSLHIRRCTAVATSYKNHVYIIGGYKGEGRCKSIERYDEVRKCWDIIP